MDIFEALPSEELETIAKLLRERTLAESDVLCREGEVGNALFIVTGGRVRLSAADSSGNENVVTHFTDGQFFGEMSLLTGAPRSGTAVAETACRVLVLEKAEFDVLLTGHARIMRAMLKVVSQRTMRTNQQLLADEPGSSQSVGQGKVIAIFSPRGGSGKTTLAVNLAVYQAQQQPERTALLDLSLTFGHTATLLGLHPQTALAGVPDEGLANFDRRAMGQYLVQHASGLELLVASGRPEDSEIVSDVHVGAALGTMKRQFTTTFVDCASTFDEPTIAALEMADRIIMVCTPELNTLRDVRECQRVFGEVIRLDLKKIAFVFNHNQPFAVLAREQFESTLEQPMGLELPHAGEAAYRAANKGEPLVLSNPGAAYSKGVEKLCRLLVPSEPKRLSQAAGVAGQTPAAHRHGGGFLSAWRNKRAAPGA